MAQGLIRLLIFALALCQPWPVLAQAPGLFSTIRITSTASDAVNVAGAINAASFIHADNTGSSGRVSIVWASNVAYFTVNDGFGTPPADWDLVVGTGTGGSFKVMTNGFNRWSVPTAGHLLAVTDNTYDIGASGATRPRDLFLGRHLTISGNLVSGATTLAEAELGYLDGVTPGTAAASKALVLDGSLDLAGFRNLTGTAAFQVSANNVASFRQRNAANSAYVDLLKLDSTDVLLVGTTGSAIQFGNASGTGVFMMDGTDFLMLDGAKLRWGTRSKLTSPAVGQLIFQNHFETAGIGLDVTTDSTLKVRNRAHSANGNVEAATFTATVAMVPSADNTIDNGASATMWRYGYFKSAIALGASAAILSGTPFGIGGVVVTDGPASGTHSHIRAASFTAADNGGATASTGRVRLPNNGFVIGRNAANGADISIIGLNTSDQVSIASGGGATVFGGDLMGAAKSRITLTGTDGNIKLANQAETGFNLLQFGGTTSSFPAFARGGATLIVRLADDSARAAFGSLYQYFGSGSPEGAVTAPVGSIYHRTDGGAGTSFYVKESGAGNTGWVAK